MKRQSIDIELRDAKTNTEHREALLSGGGAVKVPCLRIEREGEVEWMYESSDIITYLQKSLLNDSGVDVETGYHLCH